MQENIKSFNRYTAIIFSHLYDEFPKPSSMQIHELVGGEIDTERLHVCKKTESASYAAQWLADENFIKISGGSFGMYSHCILTAKGFAALNAVPDSLGGKDSIIAKIKTGLASGSSEVIKAAISASLLPWQLHSNKAFKYIPAAKARLPSDCEKRSRLTRRYKAL